MEDRNMMHWDQADLDTFQQTGIVQVGNIKEEDIFKSMLQKIDDIMLGKAVINYDQLLMQLDSETGAYDDAGPQSNGFKQATLNYRKIQNLELDPTFYEFINWHWFKTICQTIYGSNKRIDTFRTMFMNKPANKGTFLPWHQDCWNNLDQEPIITVYLALDQATIKNGCVQYIPGSHHFGTINPDHPSGFLSQENVKKFCTPDKVKYMEMQPGDIYVLHNKVIHSSDRNNSAFPRRALSICYMDADTMDIKKNKLFCETSLFKTA